MLSVSGIGEGVIAIVGGTHQHTVHVVVVEGVGIGVGDGGGHGDPAALHRPGGQQDVFGFQLVVLILSAAVFAGAVLEKSQGGVIGIETVGYSDGGAVIGRDPHTAAQILRHTVGLDDIRLFFLFVRLVGIESAGSHSHAQRRHQQQGKQSFHNGILFE